MFKIHDGTPHEPGTVYLGLIATDDGAVMLAAVDQNGECLLDPYDEAVGGGILTLTPEGKIALSPALMPSLGIETDLNGRIMLDGWCESMAVKQSGFRPREVR